MAKQIFGTAEGSEQNNILLRVRQISCLPFFASSLVTCQLKVQFRNDERLFSFFAKTKFVLFGSGCWQWHIPEVFRKVSSVSELFARPDYKNSLETTARHTKSTNSDVLWACCFPFRSDKPELIRLHQSDGCPPPRTHCTCLSHRPHFIKLSCFLFLVSCSLLLEARHVGNVISEHFQYALWIDDQLETTNFPFAHSLLFWLFSLSLTTNILVFPSRPRNLEWVSI